MLSMIAAVARTGVIGTENRLPWDLPDDLRYFRETTRGHAVILGRRNFESIGRLLPDRRNIILSRDPAFVAPEGAIVTSSADAALAAAGDDPEPFVIGGEAIYRLFLPRAERLYLTEIAADVAGDTYFPDYDRAAWREVLRRHHPADERHAFAFDFVVYER